MKIENDKIIQATEDELYSYWLSRGWDDIYPFPEYMSRMKEAGCEVIAEIPKPTLFHRITQSPEMLANFLVFHNCIYKGRIKFHSAIVGGEFDSKSEAIAATVAKLKEVVE